MNDQKNETRAAGVNEMAEAIDRFERAFESVNTSRDEFEAAVLALKGAKHYTAVDADRLAELHTKANALFKRAADQHKRDRGFIKSIRDMARTMNQWMHERARLAREGAVELEPTVDIRVEVSPGELKVEMAEEVTDEPKRAHSLGIDLDAKAVDALVAAGIYTRDQLIARVEAGDLTQIKGIGKSTAAKIEEALSQPAG